VFRLARSEVAAETKMELSEVNWPSLLRLASDENALIVLRDYVRGRPAHTIPVQAERTLAVLALQREYQLRQLQRRLEESLEALSRAGIDALLLKGGALAYTVYGGFASRPMRDIDILVRQEQAEAARDVMLDLGWMTDPEVPEDRSYDSHHHLPPLCDRTASGLRLEIHRALLPAGHPFRFTDDEIWREARVASIAGSKAFVMHPVHHAVHVAIHFAWSHMLKMGAWNAFRDLAALTAAGMVDWSDLVTTASRWGAASCCYWTLRLAQALSDLDVPPPVLTKLQPFLPEIVRRPLTRHFVNGLFRADQVCPSARLDQALWSLAMQPTRDGHGSIRPWLVSLDLLFALNQRAIGSEESLPDSALVRMRRSSRYLSAILA
jgi:Uncharacterised nucleotidyltransferase